MISLAYRRSQDTYEACKNGPIEYREVASEMKSPRYALNGLSEDAKDPNLLLSTKGVKRKAESDEILRSYEGTANEMQSLVEKHSILKQKEKAKLIRIWHQYQVGFYDHGSLRGKLTLHASLISMFLQSLEGSAIAPNTEED